MGRGTCFLEEVDLKRVLRPSDSLLPVVEGNSIGCVGSGAGRRRATDKSEVAGSWPASRATRVRKLTRKRSRKTERAAVSKKVVGEAGREAKG